MQHQEQPITSAKVVQTKAEESFGVELPQRIIKNVMRDTLKLSYRKAYP